MRQIAALFAGDVNRRIEEVIKVDQTTEDIVAAEIDEYVATTPIKRHFIEVLERYQETPQKPHEGIAIWVSGFFGSADLPSAGSASAVAVDVLLSAASVSGLSDSGEPSAAGIFFAAFDSTLNFAFGSCGSVGAGLTDLVTASASAAPADALPSLPGATDAALGVACADVPCGDGACGGGACGDGACGDVACEDVASVAAAFVSAMSPPIGAMSVDAGAATGVGVLGGCTGPGARLLFGTTGLIAPCR